MSIDSLVLSEAQQVELSRIAQSRSLPAGYVFRARLILMLAAGASFKHHQAENGDDGADHQPLEAALPCLADRRSGYQPHWTAGFCADSEAASPDSLGDPQTAEGRFHSLELPQGGVLSSRPDNMIGAFDQKLAEIALAGLCNAELGIAVP